MKYCAWPRCSVKLTGAMYCPEHKKRRKRRFDDRENTSSQRGYDRRWQRLRGNYIGKNPLCAFCKEPATEVDHIVPLKFGGEQYALSNLRSLCHECHSRLHYSRDKLYKDKTTVI